MAKVVMTITASSHFRTIYVTDSGSLVWACGGMNGCSQAIPQHVEPT
jgi:hypothetical protein